MINVYLCVLLTFFKVKLFSGLMGVCYHTNISYLYEGAECAVCGVVCDQESHVFVAQFHWSWTVHGDQRDL